MGQMEQILDGRTQDEKDKFELAYKSLDIKNCDDLNMYNVLCSLFSTKLIKQQTLFLSCVLLSPLLCVELKSPFLFHSLQFLSLSLFGGTFGKREREREREREGERESRARGKVKKEREKRDRSKNKEE